MNNLQIEYISIDELKEYKNNAKVHTADQIEQIKASIEQFGFNDPIGVWKDNEIIEGHGRLIAAQELGIDQVPVIRLDNLTDEERRAYMLVHNQLTMNTGFDDELLSIELDDIAMDMEQFGFINTVLDESQLDNGEVPDKTDQKVAVKMVFENTQLWKKQEEKVREFCDQLDKVTLSVGEYNENN